MAQFTPGPWRVQKPKHMAWTGVTGAFEIMADREGREPRLICEFPWSSPRLETAKEGEANARLIAAAPELYEALTALREVVREYILPVAQKSGRQIPIADAVGIETVFEGADKALAKVRGEDD